MKILAIIPARKGSQRIKDKNLQKVGGYNLIERALISTTSTMIDQVVITTNYKNLELVYTYEKLDIIGRAPELALGGTQLEEVLDDILDRPTYRGKYDYVVLLQPTSPLRTRNDVDAAIKQIISERSDSLFSAYPLNGFTWTIRLKPYEAFPDYDLKNRPLTQNITRGVVENGAIYIFKPQVLVDYQSRIGGKISCYLMDPLRSIDIDTPEDLELARRYYRMLQNEQNNRD